MHVMAPVCTTTGQQEFLCEDDVLHDLDREEPETWSETCDKKVGKYWNKSDLKNALYITIQIDLIDTGHDKIHASVF